MFSLFRVVTAVSVVVEALGAAGAKVDGGGAGAGLVGDEVTVLGLSHAHLLHRQTFFSLCSGKKGNKKSCILN